MLRYFRSIGSTEFPQWLSWSQWIYSWTLHNWWKLVDDRWIKEQADGKMGMEAGISSASAAPLSQHHLHYTVHCLSIIIFLWSSKTTRCCEAPKNVLDSLHLSQTSTQLSPICYAIILSSCDSLRNKKLPVLEAHTAHTGELTPHRTHCCDKSGPAVQGSWASEATLWKSWGRGKYFI